MGSVEDQRGGGIAAGDMGATLDGAQHIGSPGVAGCQGCSETRIVAASGVTPAARTRGRPRKTAIVCTPRTKDDRCRKAACEATATRLAEMEVRLAQIERDMEAQVRLRSDSIVAAMEADVIQIRQQLATSKGAETKSANRRRAADRAALRAAIEAAALQSREELLAT